MKNDIISEMTFRFTGQKMINHAEVAFTSRPYTLLDIRSGETILSVNGISTSHLISHGSILDASATLPSIQVTCFKDFVSATSTQSFEEVIRTQCPRNLLSGARKLQVPDVPESTPEHSPVRDSFLWTS